MLTTRPPKPLENKVEENISTRANSNIRTQKINAMGNCTNVTHWSYKLKKIRSIKIRKNLEEEKRKFNILVRKYERKVDAYRCRCKNRG
jgi:hypothetical protein